MVSEQRAGVSEARTAEQEQAGLITMPGRQLKFIKSSPRDTGPQPATEAHQTKHSLDAGCEQQLHHSVCQLRATLLAHTIHLAVGGLRQETTLFVSRWHHG